MASPLDDLFTMGNASEADENQQRAQEVWSDLLSQVPDVEELRVILDKAVYQGDLSPEQAQVFLQQGTAYDEVSADPRLRQAQMSALSQLQDITEQGGLSSADRGRLQQIGSEEAAASRGARESIMQNAQARGVGGSGLELANQMSSAQDSATRRSQRDFDVAGMAQQGALSAIMNSANLGGGIRGQDVGEQQRVAQARDAMSQFNAQNQNQNAQNNTNARNQAAERNINTRQGLENANTQIANNQKTYNAEAPMRRLGVMSGMASGQAGTFSDSAKHYMKQGENSKKTLGTIIGAASDVRLKQDVKSFDPDEFLDSITGYKYNYKKPDRHGEGEHAGVMAQDLEKTEVGASLVEDTPEGKMVDFGKGFGAILASLAQVNDRLKIVEGK